MNKSKPIILKIGGSVITDKNGQLSAKTQEINRLVEEIQKANVQNLVIVHGGGSFGHPTARLYSLKEGLKDEKQKIGFAETHHVMTVLNGLFMDSMVWHDIPAVSVAPSSCIITENGRVKHFEDTPLRMFLKMSLIPVLYGDAVLDSEIGFTILSGDQLIAVLATRLGAERLIIGVDVDGICDADPKVQKNAKLYERLTLEELKSIKSGLTEPTACDVTGGMFGKVTELLTVVQQEIPVTILNASKPGYVYKALVGEHVEGTVLEKE